MHAAKKYSYDEMVAAFWAKVDRTGDCWLWIARRQTDGYGQFRVGGKTLNSHKVAYELTYGAVPKGMEVMHSCHVRHCVNPGHLRLGTHAENIAEGVALGRHAYGERNRRNKITEQQAIEILALKGRAKPKELAPKYGVGTGEITAIWRGDLWKHIREAR